MFYALHCQNRKFRNNSDNILLFFNVINYLRITQEILENKSGNIYGKHILKKCFEKAHCTSDIFFIACQPYNISNSITISHQSSLTWPYKLAVNDSDKCKRESQIENPVHPNSPYIHMYICSCITQCHWGCGGAAQPGVKGADGRWL